MSDFDIIVVVVMFLAGYWIVSYLWPGSKRDASGKGDDDARSPSDTDGAGDGQNRPRR